jgi:Xaa-Pro aminopeptidase
MDMKVNQKSFSRTISSDLNNSIKKNKKNNLDGMIKLKRFQKLLQKKNIDLALVLNLHNKDPNMFYFTGMKLDGSFLLIPKKGNLKLITNKMEFERAKKYSKIKDVKMYTKPAMEFLTKIINRFGNNLGINKEVISLNEFKMLKKHFKKKKYIDISRLLLDNRKIKDEDEIDKIKIACKITDEIFSKITKKFNFKTEKEIEDFMRAQATKNGCKMAFDPIVASGMSSSMPHYRGQNVKLKKGFMVLDFGVEYKGYKSDMTRTIYLGNPTIKEIEHYNLLLVTQIKTIKKAKVGMKAKDLTQFSINSLGKCGENFIHGLGHGFGIEIHELPSLHIESKETLPENTVFTIEPGIYFENKYGIRIEDDILLQKNKKTVLTKSNKELIIIKKK